jgi:hypothetical protein
VTRTRDSFNPDDEVGTPWATSAERRMIEPALFDPSRPNIARVYDYWLGGKDNYAADRAEADRLIAVYPRLPLLARQSRLFLARAVQWLAKQGVTQFLDLGCGLPTGQTTHEIAQAVQPDCRVEYIDADPVVISHARALLCGPGVPRSTGTSPNRVKSSPTFVCGTCSTWPSQRWSSSRWCSTSSTPPPPTTSWPPSPAP